MPHWGATSKDAATHFKQVQLGAPAIFAFFPQLFAGGGIVLWAGNATSEKNSEGWGGFNAREILCNHLNSSQSGISKNSIARFSGRSSLRWEASVVQYCKVMDYSFDAKSPEKLGLVSLSYGLWLPLLLCATVLTGNWERTLRGTDVPWIVRIHHTVSLSLTRYRCLFVSKENVKHCCDI